MVLQKPQLPDESITACLRDRYGLDVTEVARLALGADLGTAVYRVTAHGDMSHFLKLRHHSAFSETTVEIPQFLHEQGIAPIITPVATTTGQLWTMLGSCAVILYPFVEGNNGFDSPLSDRQWVELGAAMGGVHRTIPPSSLSGLIPGETYSPRWRDRVRAMQARAARTAFTDPIAIQLAEFLRSFQETINFLVERAEHLSIELRAQSPAYVLCHADLHAGNVLIGRDGSFHIVDWDTVLLAPRERDLMFIGGGIGGVWNGDREVELFYRGYGATVTEPTALTYYRYERIVEDIAVYCDEILQSTAGNSVRADSLNSLRSQFEANDVVEIAIRSDPFMRP